MLKLFKVAFPEFLPFFGIMRKPFSKPVLRSYFFYPEIKSCFVLPETSWPEPIHKYPESILIGRLLVDSFNSDQWVFPLNQFNSFNQLLHLNKLIYVYVHSYFISVFYTHLLYLLFISIFDSILTPACSALVYFSFLA